MANDLIRYDLRVQDALRGVIRKVIAEAARDGLPGEHHFQLSFRTDAPGVVLSAAMRRKFSQEMTIILQHQYRDLSVTDQVVEVVLFFNNVPERLVIPLTAITGFFDPSVDFGLRFEVRTDSEPMPASPPKLVPVRPASPEPVRSIPRGAGSEPREVSPAKPMAEAARTGKNAKESGPASKPADTKAGDAKAGEGKVVSIDAFRRKP